MEPRNEVLIEGNFAVRQPWCLPVAAPAALFGSESGPRAGPAHPNRPVSEARERDLRFVIPTGLSVDTRWQREQGGNSARSLESRVADHAPPASRIRPPKRLVTNIRLLPVPDSPGLEVFVR